MFVVFESSVRLSPQRFIPAVAELSPLTVVTSSARAHPFGKEKKIHTGKRRREKSEGKLGRKAKAKTHMKKLKTEVGACQR